MSFVQFGSLKEEYNKYLWLKFEVLFRDNTVFVNNTQHLSYIEYNEIL